MAYYLQMNGTSDVLQLPTMSATKVNIDCSIDPTQDNSRDVVLDSRSGSTFFLDIGFTNMHFTIDGGTDKVSNTDIPKDNIRHTLSIYANVGATTVMTDNYTIFAKNDGTTQLKGQIWDVKVYNGATLQAHYDMTLGNVQDQSGNGNNATLTGGTFVSDATGTTQTGASSVQGVSTITADATVIGAITGSASLQGVATLAATATVLNAPMLGSAALQGISNLTATGTKVQTGGASLTGVATSTVFAQGLTVLGGAPLSGVGVLTASGVSGASIARAISLFGSLPSPIALLGESVAAIHLQASWTSAVSLFGSKPEPIALEGGLMTKTKQDFTMYAGDTPPLTFTMADSTSLSGATVKWSLRKGNVKGTQVLLKTTSSGLSVSGTVATISLLNADTLSLEGQYYHEAEVTDVSGNVSTVMTGTVTITPSGV